MSIEAPLNNNQCPFCNLVTSESPFVAKKGENISLVISLEGHPLIIPNNHVKPEEVTPELASEMSRWSLGESLKRIREFFGADGINVMTNDGIAAGQEIEHTHTHILPRYINEARRFPKLTRKPDEKRQEIAEGLRAYLEDLS